MLRSCQCCIHVRSVNDEAQHTCSEDGKPFEHSLVLSFGDPLVDQCPGLASNKQDEEQERKLMHDVLIHDAVVQRLNADRGDQKDSKISRELLALSEGDCSMEATCCSNLHGCIIR